jgi:hypothetical protein
MYQPGDVVEFQMNLGGEPIAKGVVVGTLANDYRVMPQGRDQVWVIHPEEIKRKIGHIELASH